MRPEQLPRSGARPSGRRSSPWLPTRLLGSPDEVTEPSGDAIRPPGVTDPPSLRFEAAFDRHARVVLAYALRRSTTEDDAEDAVAETFAVAWRRVDHLPEAEAALPWLLAIARRVTANQRRGSARRVRLGLRLRLARQPEPDALLSPESTPALDALARLGRDDQELLRLLAWEELSHAAAG